MFTARTLSLFLVLYATWLLLSGIWEPFPMATGAVASLLVVVIAHRLDVIDGEGHPVHLSLRALAYFPWLLWRIALANLEVARIVLRPGALELDTACGEVPAGQRSDIGRVTFANSITLTPGTVSLSVHPDGILVHALTRRDFETLLAGEMDRRVRAMEGER